MKICPNCQNENEDSAKFCAHCAWKFSRSQWQGSSDTIVDEGGGYGYAPDDDNPGYYTGGEGGYTGNGGQYGGGGRRNNTPILIGIIILAIAVLFLIVALIVRALLGPGDSGGSGTETTVVQESDTEPPTTEPPTTQPPTTEPPTTQPPTTQPPTTQPPTTTRYQPSTRYEGCIFPYSSDEYLSESDLYGLSDREIRYARNEIYARHGRRFTDESLQEHFEQFSWYHPSVDPDDFSESVFNSYERANVEMIKGYEERHGIN